MMRSTSAVVICSWRDCASSRLTRAIWPSFPGGAPLAPRSFGLNGANSEPFILVLNRDALFRFARAFWGRIVRHTRYDSAMDILECDSRNGHRSRRGDRIFSLSRGRAKCPPIWLPARRRYCRFALDDAQFFCERAVLRPPTRAAPSV
jgi:hypothetical protein